MRLDDLDKVRDLKRDLAAAKREVESLYAMRANGLAEVAITATHEMAIGPTTHYISVDMGNVPVDKVVAAALGRVQTIQGKLIDLGVTL